MSIFNFNSQICTNKNQSKRLLALGLKKETADMCLTDDVECTFPCPEDDRFIPAWSLHRLYELYNSTTPLIDSIQLIPYLYDTIIDKFEVLIEADIFNKEYLV